MFNPQLVDYIKKQLEGGRTEETIKTLFMRQIATDDSIFKELTPPLAGWQQFDKSDQPFTIVRTRPF
jgi:hypothetical protein